MRAPATAPLVLSIRSLRKDRAQGTGAAYSLSVPHLDVRLGEKLLITGPSGCGKSTLLDIAGMVLRPDSVRGFAFFPEARAVRDTPARNGAREATPPMRRTPSPISPAEADSPRDVAEAWNRDDVERLSRWRRHVGYVLQTGGLLPFVSVRENILTPCRLLDPARAAEFAPLAEKLALTLGISHLLHKFPAQLSVGERQRTAIARALAANPPLVLADEPTAALDPANAATVLALFSRMVDELGSTLIMVSHAPEQMRDMGFRRLRVRLEPLAEDGLTGTLAVLSDEDGFPETTDGAPPDQTMAGPPADSDRSGGGGPCLR